MYCSPNKSPPLNQIAPFVIFYKFHNKKWSVDENDSQHQIQQMITFILNEAKDKAEEIESGAIEDFNVEKMNIFEQRKDEIRAKLLKSVNSKRLKQNKAKNAAHMDLRNRLLSYKCDIMDSISLAALEQIEKITHNADSYSEILTLLILSGSISLCSDNIQIRCRAKDVSLVTACIPKVKEKFAALVSNDNRVRGTIDFQVDNTNHISDDSIGVVLFTANGKIECDCTLNTRLNRCFKMLTPEFKKALFPPLAAT
ncbi:bifunctional V-type ATPase subunit E/V-type ATPase subunit E [Babesia duncani]|uniref:Bifunctional V-type ATPase subunit E/V-type ATPase subunit E n=1 Tax=Babesia duncani TaxID=323732 RepID=A0AAD9UNJ1_9APIC|nr:bifunctional V-type ATPase subunit E/V-type ATPase subunit E [Babesia duncani]